MQETIQRTDIEEIQRDVSAPSVDVKRSPDVQGGDQLHAELGSIADGFDVTGFKCGHEECGLVHNHDTTKHRASDSGNMSDEQAAGMEFNPNCHCGLNEAARRGMDWAPSPSRANNMAPIPDGTSRAMDRMF